MQSAVLMDRWIYSDSNLSDTSKKALAVGFGIVSLALLAQISFPLPYTPVPITGQTFGVLVIAGCLGAKLGTLTTLLYIALGSFGLPIFADQSGGWQVTFGATGGYLAGMAASAYVIGKLSEAGWDRQLGRSLAMFTVGHAIIFALGMTWLKVWAPELDVIGAGLLPFLPGAVIKTMIAAGIFPVTWWGLRK